MVLKRGGGRQTEFSASVSPGLKRTRWPKFDKCWNHAHNLKENDGQPTLEAKRTNAAKRQIIFSNKTILNLIKNIFGTSKYN